MRRRSRKKEKTSAGKRDNVPCESIAEVLLFLQLHMKKEEVVWQFLKEVHEWYGNEFAEAVVPPPQFPNWVLSGAGPSELVTSASELEKKKATATPLKKPIATAAPKPGNAAKSPASSKGKVVMVEEVEEEQEHQGSLDSAKVAEEKENEDDVNEAEEEEVEREQSVVGRSAEERERKSKAEAEERERKKRLRGNKMLWKGLQKKGRGKARLRQSLLGQGRKSVLSREPVSEPGLLGRSHQKGAQLRVGCPPNNHHIRKALMLPKLRLVMPMQLTAVMLTWW